VPPHRLDDAPVLPPPAVEISRRPNPFQRAAHVWRYRELLGNLVRKELKVKYKNSVLGFLWTLLNPMLYLVVFSIVFQEVLQVRIPYFAIFFLSGLLAWNFFATALSAGTGSIVGNAQLVQKVWFPREILPLSSMGAAMVHFTLQLLVLAGAMVVFQRPPNLDYFPALALAIVVLLVLAAALAIALSAVNVYLRDTEHLLELVLLAWFWMSAIVYPYQLVADRLGPDREWMAALNPMIPIITTFQKALYNPSAPFRWFTNSPTDPLSYAPVGLDGKQHAVVPDRILPTRIPDQSPAAIPMSHDLAWYLTHLAVVGVVAALGLLGALWLFGRLEDNLAEEI
jgi:ABC-2 type transport system permease protein